MQNDSYEELDAEYHRLLDAYGEALAAKDPIASGLLDQAAVVWRRLRAFEGTVEARAEPDAHLFMALSHAIVANDAAEARRLYDLMDDQARAAVDSAEILNPGSVKIWS